MNPLYCKYCGKKLKHADAAFCWNCGSRIKQKADIQFVREEEIRTTLPYPEHTVEPVEKLIDILAYYKLNSLQLYIEHAFDFNEYRCFLEPQGYLTAEEILELDDYCYENFIDFIPSLSTFGHLYRLLETKEYKHLCELDEFTPDPNLWLNRMLHHTIDASNPESFELISSLIDQYIPLFRSKYFNICCDETFDLCNGRNKGKDKGALYLEFTTKLITHVSSRGKTVMMWLITAFPVLVAIALPQFIVARIGFIYLIMGVSGPAYLNSRLLRDIFDKVNGSPIVSAPEDEE